MTLTVRIALIRILTIGLALGVYETLARSGKFYAGAIPTLGIIAAALGGQLRDPALYHHLGITLGEIAIGFALALSAGVAAGIALGSRKIVGALAQPYVDALATAPKIVFFPIAILVFGIGPPSKVALGALSAFFPIVISVAAGVREISPTLIRVGRSFRANPWQMARKIYLPALVRPIVTGMRLGLGLCVVGVLLAEIKLSDRGIGFLTIDHYNHYRIPQMYALLIVIFALAVLVNALMSRIRLDPASRG